MASFRKLCEAIKPGQDFWDHKKQPVDLDHQALSVIQRGLEIRPDRTDGSTFWDDFVAVLGNNSEDASHLLGISSSVIASWSTKIRKAVDHVRDENDASDERADMVSTGDQDINK